MDEALGDLVARASDVLATQGRLCVLLKANQLISQQLDLTVVLRRIVETAIDLVDARYGALGVISPDGSLEQFIHVGMADDEVSGIGRLPEGHGLLGALIDDLQPIRLPQLADDERSMGFPEQHPQMESFLGVPIRVGDQVFGNLYLTNAASGEFSADDEELVTALASTVGFAIDNARLFERAKRRQAWLAASAEPLFFVNGGLFNQWVRQVVQRAVRENRGSGREPLGTLVLASEPITDLDTTAAEELVDLDDWLAWRGITLVFAEIKGPVKDTLERYGLNDRFTDERFAPTVGAAVDAITGELRTDIEDTPDV